MTLPEHDIGDRVLITPMDNMEARVVELLRTAEDGWFYSVRYIANSEAKTMRCFPDELRKA